MRTAFISHKNLNIKTMVLPGIIALIPSGVRTKVAGPSAEDVEKSKPAINRRAIPI